MIPLGLTTAELRDLHRLLCSNHWVNVTIQMLNLDHEYLGDLSRKLIDGQVDIDADADITRSLKLYLLDPNNQISLTSDSPDDGAMFADRMIKVIYSVTSPDYTRSYDIPLFCGPIRKVSKDGFVTAVEAQGKESLSYLAPWKIRTFKKNLKLTTIIRRIAVEMMGENRISIPDRAIRSSRNITVNREKTMFGTAKEAALSMDHHLFYDGRGRMRLRRLLSKPVFVFRDGPGGSLTSMPEFGFDHEDMYNAVEVIGANPKGPTKRIRYRLVAGRKHSLSPWKLGRTNAAGDFVPRYIPHAIQDDNIRTMTAARARARRVLRMGLVESVDASFDSLVIPHLEELDVYRLKTAEYSVTARIRKMSIPLASGTMTVGYNRRVMPRIRKIRRRKRRRS